MSDTDLAISELAGAVEDLAGHFALEPLLQRILRRAVGLLGGAAGSICTVDEAAGTYRKEADLGVRCRQGAVFSLGEGTTGAVVAQRGPVVFERYSDVPGGHLAADERERMYATVAVPIEWAGAIIGACVVFSSDPGKRWDRHDVALLQLFAGHAAVALANARLHADASERERRLAVETDRERVQYEVHETLVRTLGDVLEHARYLDHPAITAEQREHLTAIGEATSRALAETRRTVLDSGPVLGRQGLAEAVRQELSWLRATTGIQTDLVVTGDPSRLTEAIGRPALQAVQEALSNVGQHSGTAQVRVGILCADRGITILVSDNGRGFDTATSTHRGLDRAVAVIERAGGSLSLETAPEWGTRVRIELPTAVVPTPAESADPKLRVLVADPRVLVRAGLLRLLAPAQPGVVVIGEAPDLDTALRQARSLDPDLILVGLAPDRVLLDRLRAATPGIALLAVADRRLSLSQQAGLTRLGVGVVNLDVDAVALAVAVRAAAAGDPLATTENGLPEPVDTLADALTEREWQVVDLVGRGWPDKQVALELAISVKTVEKHVGAALRKTGLKNRTALATQLTRR